MLTSSAIRTSQSSSAAVSLLRSTDTEKSFAKLGIMLGCWTDEPGAEIVVTWSPASKLAKASKPSSSSIRLGVSPSNSHAPLRLSFRRYPTTGSPTGSASTDSEGLISTGLLELLRSSRLAQSILVSFKDYDERRTGTET